PGCSAAARLSCFAHIVWHRPGDAAKWQELHRYASPRLQPALEKRCLQLGHYRSSVRPHQQGQIPGSESPRSRPRPRVAFGRRSVALRRLHHAGQGNSVRPFIRGDEERSCVIPKVTAPATSCTIFNRACPGLAHTRLPTSTSDSHHPFLQSNRLGENLKKCTKKALAKRWGVQTYRQLSGWNPPPLMIRAFRAHCQLPTLFGRIVPG